MLLYGEPNTCINITANTKASKVLKKGSVQMEIYKTIREATSVQSSIQLYIATNYSVGDLHCHLPDFGAW